MSHHGCMSLTSPAHLPICYYIDFNSWCVFEILSSLFIGWMYGKCGEQYGSFPSDFVVAVVCTGNSPTKEALEVMKP